MTHKSKNAVFVNLKIFNHSTGENEHYNINHWELNTVN